MRNLTLSAVQHQPWLEYRHTLPDGRICIRIRTARDEWDSVQLCSKPMYPSVSVPVPTAGLTMCPVWQDDLHQWYEVVLTPEDPRLHYLFLFCSDGRALYLDQDGWCTWEQLTARDIVWFPYAHAWAPPAKPDWARGKVGYQIFPDRFRRSGTSDEAVEPWGSPRVANEYRFGGNLAGMLEAVPYLKELGIGIVYMTPLFLSDTSHRYNTFDYYQIDPLLGTTEQLKALADALHAAGMRLVLDGVFNHSGTQFPPFIDAQEKGAASPYYDWFHFGDQYPCGYATFSTTPYMPKLNLANPKAQAYFLDVGQHWIKTCGIDGWRLDVSPEVWPDFWRQYRKAVLAANPEAILVAECWDDSREWLSIGDMFDSTMHYVLSRAMWGFFATDKLSLAQFDASINRAMALYPQAIQEVLWNFLGSHDTARFLTRAGGDPLRLRLAAFFQMTHPGVPIIYYGDELGMEGGDDPECRRCFPWEQVAGNQMLDYYRRLIALRNATPALQTGSFITWHVGENGIYAYLRQNEQQTALVIVNTANQPTDCLLPLPAAFASQTSLMDALSGSKHQQLCHGLPLHLNSGEGKIFIMP